MSVSACIAHGSFYTCQIAAQLIQTHPVQGSPDRTMVKHALASSLIRRAPKPQHAKAQLSGKHTLCGKRKTTALQVALQKTKAVHKMNLPH